MGRGLALLVQHGAFSVLDEASIRLWAQAHTLAYQLLAIRVGRWLVFNVYVFNGAPGPAAFRQLTVHIAELLGGRFRQQLVVAGDFNHPAHHNTLHAAMQGDLQLVPTLLAERGHWTYARPNHPNSLLDNIYAPSCVANLDQINFDGAPGDHAFVIVRLRADPGPAQPQARPVVDAIRYCRIRNPSTEANRAARQHLLALLQALPAQLGASPAMDTLNAALIATARTALGVHQPRPQLRKPWMGDPNVQRALGLLRRAKHLAVRAGYRQHRDLLRLAQSLFRRAQARAQRSAKRSLLVQVENGDMTVFHAMFRASRNKRSGGGNTARFPPALDPEAAATAWSAIFRRHPHAVDPAELSPLVPEITLTITAQDVRSAIKAHRNSAPGPDGLEVCVLRLGSAALADTLAAVFTRALSAFPAALRVGASLLLPKTQPPSADPMAYRPITLLPVLVRLFHKTIDQRLRALLFPDGPLGDRHVLSRAQAGFVPGRSTHEQALILLQLGCSSPSAWAAFLDIEKAFDSFDHAELLDILRHRLPLEWVEVIRRLLAGNSTIICGVRVELGRGCAQGSPLSPTLCDCFVDDLAQAVAEHLRAHPEDFQFSLRGMSPLAAARVLVYLLLFADDVTILAESPAALQRLLVVVAQWAHRRRVRFSPKSFFACLHTSTAEAAAPPPPLTLGDLAVPLFTGSQRYLGVPWRTYAPHQRWNPTHPLDMDTLNRNAGALVNTFRLPNGQIYATVPALVRGLYDGLLASALYPTPVVDVDYEALDQLVLSTARRVLVLPPTCPSLLLHWELRIMPSKFLGHLRALRFANAFARQSWFYAHAIAQASSSDLHYWTKQGPLARLTDLLKQYAYYLFKGTFKGNFKPSTREVWTCTADVAKQEWAKRVRVAVRTQYASWHRAEANQLPTGYRVTLQTTLSVLLLSLPVYLRRGGNRARAALRLKCPTLRQHFHQQEQPLCLWCRVGTEEGRHIIACPRIPAALNAQVTPVLSAIASEASIRDVPGNANRLHNALIRMEWIGQQSSTLRDGLQVLGLVLQAYRQASLLVEAPGGRQIWPVSRDA